MSADQQERLTARKGESSEQHGRSTGQVEPRADPAGDAISRPTTETGRSDATAGRDRHSVLEHPLFGVRRRRTLAAWAFTTLFTALFAVSYLGTTVTVGGAPLETLTARFDTISTVVILFAMLLIVVVPLLYAAWNGGPVTAVALPLVPVALGQLAAGQYVIDLDAAIALSAGAAAGAVAIYATDVRSAGSIRPWRQDDPDSESLVLVTAVVIVSAVAVGRFVATVPPYVFEWYAPFAVLWMLPGVILLAYWSVFVRSVLENHIDASSPNV